MAAEKETISLSRVYFAERISFVEHCKLVVESSEFHLKSGTF